MPMRCSQCQFENREGVRFGEECGVELALACPACGTVIPPGRKFCGSCGQALAQRATPAVRRFSSPESYTPKHLAERILTSKSALEGERKQVTVLFADLKGSMELLADRDPEDARKILDPVLEHMMDAVHRYEGTVNQVMGDGIMALFGAPVQIRVGLNPPGARWGADEWPIVKAEPRNALAERTRIERAGWFIHENAA